MKTRRMTVALIVGLGLTMGLLLVLNSTAVLLVHAAPPPTYRYVATTGNDSLNDCKTSTFPCRTVQHAVNVAGINNVILVAKGIYDDLHTHSVPDGYFAPPASGVITQVLYIDKTVAIRGGYTTAFKEPPDPSSNSTSLQVPAGQLGRVVVIAGDIHPTLYGFRIVNGDATGLGGGWGSRDAGGGVFIFTATATLDTNTITLNKAYDGAGLYLRNSDATLVDSLITENTASNGSGGGLYLHASDATLSENTIYANTAYLHGGAAYLNYSKAELTDNTIFSNHATNGAGGALHLVWYSEATITGNTIESNTAGSQGGGMYLNYSNAVLDANTIRFNSADDEGGGLALENDCSASLTANVIVSNDAGLHGGGVYIRYSDPDLDKNIVRLNSARWGGGVYLENSEAVLTNTVITENQAPSNGGGSGLYIEGSSPRLLHTTIAHNSGGDGSGVYVTEATVPGYLSDVVLTNTILVNHGVGITVTAGNTATLDGVLWHSNTVDWGGGGAISGSHYTWGDPHFAVDGYHLSSDSAALDVGLSSGVTADVDGDTRPYCTAPDLGADEAVGDFACQIVYLPLELRNN
ncbi:MAG: right-handed parallel beta-helix repeat-containing protein [Anaerolineae bacterium]|jgi:parallel beta-helix repeat protein